MRTSFLRPVRKMDIGLIRQMLNNENITADEKTAVKKQIQELPEIFRLLASLEDDTQKLLLNNWASSELVLNEEIVGQLLDYLRDFPAESNSEKLAVIKAFAFLELNNLPKTEELINALRSVFTQDKNLTQSLNQLLSEDQISDQVKNKLKAELGLNFEQKAEHPAAENIKSTINKSELLLSLLDKEKTAPEKNLIDNLLGQKLVNIDLQEDNSPIMLALEIPVNLKNQNKLLPLFLKIAEEQENEKNSKSAKKARQYEITLITELPLIGTIKSTIKLKNKNLNAEFLSESKETIQLIEKNLEKLKSILEEHGFMIDYLRTAEFDDNYSDQSNFFNEIILAEFDIDNNRKGKYTHLDIRV
ncbi:MAG: flagellar hook-length control protein FliK [Halanaerobium sp.]